MLVGGCSNLLPTFARSLVRQLEKGLYISTGTITYNDHDCDDNDVTEVDRFVLDDGHPLMHYYERETNLDWLICQLQPYFTSLFYEMLPLFHFRHLVFILLLHFT